MKNKEKYAEEILYIVCNCDSFAVDVKTNKPRACSEVYDCAKCKFYNNKDDGDWTSCTSARKQWAEQEYTEPPVDWSKVEVDTPILVRSSESDEWIRRHFAKFEDGFVYAWSIGKTHWSVGDECDVTDWKYAKLVESEE